MKTTRAIALLVAVMALFSVTDAYAVNTVATSTDKVKFGGIGGKAVGWNITFAATASAGSDTSYAIVPVGEMWQAFTNSGTATYNIVTCVELSSGMGLAAADSARTELYVGSLPATIGSGNSVTSGAWHKLTTFATDGTSNFTTSAFCRAKTTTTAPLNYIKVFIINKHSSTSKTYKMYLRLPQ